MRATVFFAAVGLLLLCVAATVSADESLKLDFEKYELPNGLDVILHQDHSIPMVSVNVWYHVGSKNERPGRTGFAHLFEHMMFQGSSNYNNDYFVPIQSVGGEVNGSTNSDRTNYWENLPAQYLELGLAMEADRMAHLDEAMTQEKLANQRDVVSNERRQNYDNAPYGIAGDVIAAMMYPPEHPYSWTTIGSIKDVQAGTLEDVKEFFQEFYVPNNASLVVAGDFDMDQARAWIDEYFGPVEPGPKAKRLKDWNIQLDGQRRELIEDEVELSRVYLNWHTPAFYEPGDAEFDLLSSVLVGGKNARLQKTLVYDLQLCQDINAFQASREVGSMYQIIATVAPGHTPAEVEEAINNELQKLFDYGITEEELQLAKTTWESSFVRRLEGLGGFGGRADLLNSYNIMLGDPGGLQFDMNRYAKPTANDVVRYAKEYLTPDHCGILTVVPVGDLHATELNVNRAEHPDPLPEPEFMPPVVQHAVLDNGLKILLVEDHSLPLVDMQLVVKRGMLHDPKGLYGLASLTSDMLNEGSKKYDGYQISTEALKLGAQTGTAIDDDYSQFNLNILKKNFGKGLDLVADYVLNPTFPQAELDRLKKQYRGNLQQFRRQAAQQAFTCFRQVLYGPDNPLYQPYTGGTSDEFLDKVTRDDLVAFHKANYVPNVTTVAISGDLTLNEARTELERVFGKWKRGDVPMVAGDMDPQPPAKTKIYLRDMPGSEQSYVLVGHNCMSRNDPSWTTYQIFNRLFGGQFMCRVNMNLREDKGYTYGAGAFVWTGQVKSPFIAYAPVQSEYTSESVSELVKELRDVGSYRLPTDEEVAKSRDGYLKSFPQGFETLGAMTNGLKTLAVYGLPLDNWVTLRDRVDRISDEDIRNWGKEHLKADALTIVVVGDRSKVEDKLKALNLGDIEII